MFTDQLLCITCALLKANFDLVSGLTVKVLASYLTCLILLHPIVIRQKRTETVYL